MSIHRALAIWWLARGYAFRDWRRAIDIYDADRDPLGLRGPNPVPDQWFYVYAPANSCSAPFPPIPGETPRHRTRLFDGTFKSESTRILPFKRSDR